MTKIATHYGDQLIAEYESIQKAIRDYAFPALLEEEVTDDGETFMALRCPRCDGLVTNAGDLFAISPAEHWAESDDIGDWQMDHQSITFDSSEHPDLESTLYYRHGDSPGHAVSLPDGWTEDWT